MAEIKAALAALQMAIQTEIDGHKFYQEFAAKTQDPNAQAMFERLAREEVMHLELLDAQRAVLEQSGEWAEYQGLTLEPAPGAPIFSRERVEQNIVAYTSDLSALRMARCASSKRTPSNSTPAPPTRRQIPTASTCSSTWSEWNRATWTCWKENTGSCRGSSSQRWALRLSKT